MIDIEELRDTRPFIIYSDRDISGTVGGNPSVESYCSLDYTSASRYRLNRDDHNQIFQFFGNLLGSTNKPVYCLDKFADGPYNDVPYESRPFETLFPAATERQKEMLGWILANTYPAVSAAATFALAGVDPNASPALDDNDAYAVVQTALWVLLGQIAPDEVYFLDCADDNEHPKSDRMRAAVLALLKLAGDYVDAEPDVPVPSLTPNDQCCTGDCGIKCCNKSVLPTDTTAPYFIFKGCPDEVRTVCGRMLIGPFRILSSFDGRPEITVTPFCSCREDYSVTFMDFCGNPISDPVIGQEFYIALRTCGKYACFTVKASFTGTITRVITMEAQSTALNYQPIGTSFDDVQIGQEAELCVCAEYPSADCSVSKGQGGYTGININNNNNNNNNNNTNNSCGAGGFPVPFPCMMPCYPGWGRPPELPYPPYPPYPPEPPYPPRPPYPPEPPWPPRPPYPPEPPWPPYPPEPPCRPEPPCKPEPPCRPEPPCKPEHCCPICSIKSPLL